MSAVEGYVLVKSGGEARYRHALKMKGGSDHNRVARYPKSGGDGVWCGKDVSSTFIEYPWNVPQERMQALMAYQAELDRLIPSRRGAYQTYDCLICGALVGDRAKHLRWHKGESFYETIVSLFGRPY